jgi:hypothetical protein
MTNAIEKQKKILRLIFQPCQVNMCERIICLGIRKRMYMYTQDVHSGRRNGALNDRKRRFTALIFTLFHRNPSVRITTAVSCYGTTIVLHRFYIHFWTDGLWPPFPVVFRRFIAVSGRLRAVLLDLGIYRCTIWTIIFFLSMYERETMAHFSSIDLVRYWILKWTGFSNFANKILAN